MNQSDVIAPYKYLGMWVFVDGADTIVDQLTQYHPQIPTRHLLWQLQIH